MSSKKQQGDLDLLVLASRQDKGDLQSASDRFDLSCEGVACVSVLVPYPVDKAYDYALPSGMEVEVGDYVLVPLSGREVPAVVWGAAAGDVKPSKIKSIIHRYDMVPMATAHRDFIAWVARYTMSRLGFVLKMALSTPKGLEPPKPVKAYRLPAQAHRPEKFSPQRGRVWDFLHNCDSPQRSVDLVQGADVSAGVIKGMADKGLLEVVMLYNPAPCKAPDPERAGPVLSEDQAAAASRLREAVAAQKAHVALLDGVTGAGKTEVYFEAVAEALKAGRQVLILLPEIALSNAFLDRFQARFGCAPALWHSHLSQGARAMTWRGVAQGETKVVIGARSALFLPYADLGLIIVDEEHDPAYKQEDGVIYHARDMAVVRGHLGSFPVALVSATPSLETMHNVWAGKYEHLHLADRFGGASLPKVSLIDMRAEKMDAAHFVSLSLREAVSEVVARGEQALLFLNRRGYAPLTLCRTCGHRMECPRCSAWLVEHRGRKGLQCHHCDFSLRVPKTCPECENEGSLVACGPGIERVYEEMQHYFPEAKILMLASDTIENGEALRAALEEVRDGKVDIIIGTQIIAKGHHFPHLTLVGVVDADLGLQGGELRAAERVYQLLHQVAGRAGRAEKKGRVMLQSFMPEHRIMKALVSGMDAGGRDGFLAVEAQEREAAHMPPFSRLAGIIISGRDESLVIGVTKALGRSAPQEGGIRTLGPAPAPFARLRGQFRYRLLVQADKGLDLQKTLAHWIGEVKVPSKVRVYIDIDPQSFL